MKLKARWKDPQARRIALLVLTGLIVSWVRQGLEHHWKAFASWEMFFASWIIHTIGIAVFTAIAFAAITYLYDFFVGDERTDDSETVMFYIVMTVLVGALCIAFVANYVPSDDDYSALIGRQCV